MSEKADIQKNIDGLQITFTAYVARAVRRRRRDYVLRQAKLQWAENLREDVQQGAAFVPGDVQRDPLPMQLESDKLLYALGSLTERERNIFLSRVLDEKRFQELGEQYGLSYKNVTTIYYRAIRKIKKKMENTNDEL